MCRVSVDIRTFPLAAPVVWVTWVPAVLAGEALFGLRRVEGRRARGDWQKDERLSDLHPRRYCIQCSVSTELFRALTLTSARSVAPCSSRVRIRRNDRGTRGNRCPVRRTLARGPRRSGAFGLG